MRTPWIAAGLVACASPPSHPLTAPSDLAVEPNALARQLDAGRPADPPPREPEVEVLAPLPPPPPPNCRRDSDCVVSVFAACCSIREPYGLSRGEAQEQARECKGLGRCIDYEHVELAGDLRSYVAKCQALRCVAVRR